VNSVEELSAGDVDPLTDEIPHDFGLGEPFRNLGDGIRFGRIVERTTDDNQGETEKIDVGGDKGSVGFEVHVVRLFVVVFHCQQRDITTRQEIVKRFFEKIWGGL
jgi:hypothetical protein